MKKQTKQAMVQKFSTFDPLLFEIPWHLLRHRAIRIQQIIEDFNHLRETFGTYYSQG